MDANSPPVRWVNGQPEQPYVPAPSNVDPNGPPVQIDNRAPAAAPPVAGMLERLAAEFQRWQNNRAVADLEHQQRRNPALGVSPMIAEAAQDTVLGNPPRQR